MSHSAQIERYRMVVEQLQARGIRSERVLAALGQIARERFVPAASRHHAYADRALPIGFNQTISQPFIVALMTEALDLTGVEHILEVGTGSGYQAAILAELGRDVVTIERHAGLAHTASQLLSSLGYRNIQFVCGDGTRGWTAAAPFDRILVTAGAATCPHSLWGQLADGGILVMPIGARDAQVLQCTIKRGGQRDVSNLSGCRFVPLIGVEGWPN
ncbi:MAG: protein-L-isoaspartate O-methyltransferase [Planctomycetes bacterium RBG_16_64_10]|nr:MAG: protein-L-isoaspartate O-methyltransferase [Planctomycetes bacterium RBG_16_64_10]